MMVRWLSHEKDILSNWSDTGQMIFQCKGLIQSNGHGHGFPRKETSCISGQVLIR